MNPLKTWSHSLGLALLLLTPSAQAFVLGINGSGQLQRWPFDNPPAQLSTNILNRSTRALRYFIAADAYSPPNTTAEINAVRASFGQWQAIPGTKLKFEEGGLLAPGIDVNTADHTNAVFWTKSTTLINGGRDDISGQIAVTFISFLLDNTLLEADIVLNGVEIDWFTDFNDKTNPGQFVESTVSHEIGHLLGLKHSPIGGATMIGRGNPGIDPIAGLSPDEVAFAQGTYAQANLLTTLGHLRGLVTRNDTPVFGAIVVLEDLRGNTVSGTVTRSDGRYDFPAITPGSFHVRATPLDPAGAPFALVRGASISSDYNVAQTDFLPTTNTPVFLQGGLTNVLNLAVTQAQPAFRIAFIRLPTSDPAQFALQTTPIALELGQTDFVIGVASPDLPTDNATFTATGDGLTVGETLFEPDVFEGIRVISATITVATNATPGLRTLSVQQGDNIAYANGFLEILPPNPDHNFDGLDDTFQRRFFPVFTAPEAGPSSNPDQDEFDNAAEAQAGTNPTNALSHLVIEQVTQTSTDITVTWQSVPGKRYQLLGRNIVTTGPWEPVGLPVTATDTTAQATDPKGANTLRYYLVQVLP